MRLPPELRLIIYRCCLPHERKTPHSLLQAVYYENLRDVWSDQPSPLLQINKKICGEVSDLLQRDPAYLRVTGQGISFDDAGLSACFAQDFRGDFGKIHHLVVGIWPPHFDRPVENLYIWDHLRKLRDMLRKCTLIRKLTLEFMNNTSFSWVGAQFQLLSRLPSRGFRRDSRTDVPDADDSDVKAILELFTTLTNVQQAEIRFPEAFGSYGQNKGIYDYAEFVRQIMLGLIKPVMAPTFLENLEFESLEKYLKHTTAVNIRRKLETASQNGRQKLSESKYDNMVRRWPYFEALTWYGDKKFLGKWHYAKTDT